MDREFDQAAIERVALECELEVDDVSQVLYLYEILEGDSNRCLCSAWYPHECCCHCSWED